MRLDIKKVASMLGVTLTTLRRWDAQNLLKPDRASPRSHRYYDSDEIEDFLASNFKYLKENASGWEFAIKDPESIILPRFYCEDSSIFKARLSRLEKELQKDSSLKDNFSLVTSMIGEIGNNSFDHNIGNWPNIPGIFFGYDLKARKIILADRGRGVLATLKNARAGLKNDKEAVTVAFNEVLSGRSPESRGNGLKYVKKVITSYSMSLEFQSGKAMVHIDKQFSVISTTINLKGCFAVLNYKNL